MLPVQRKPEAPPSRRGSKLFAVWLGALALIVVDELITRALRPLHIPGLGIFGFITFLACLVLIALTLYGFAVFVRWMLRRLFWRVGRRLFLSYVLIGVLPFFLFAILMLTVGYMIAGVMTHAALHGERQASLGQLESAAFEYSLTGKRPAGVTKSLEIYDTKDASGAQLPPWLKATTFSGMVWRDNQAYLVASREVAHENAPQRTIVFVEPLDSEWIEQLQDKSGMTVRMGTEGMRGHGIHVSRGGH